MEYKEVKKLKNFRNVKKGDVNCLKCGNHYIDSIQTKSRNKFCIDGHHVSDKKTCDNVEKRIIKKKSKEGMNFEECIVFVN